MNGVRERLVLNALYMIGPTTIQAVRFYLKHKSKQFYSTNQVAAAIRVLLDHKKIGWKRSARGTTLYFVL